MKYVLALITGIIGLVLGALVVLFLLGAPKAKSLPGSPVQAPDPGGDAPGTAVITLDEKFFDALLASVFRDLGQPSFPLELTMMNEGVNDSGLNVIPAALQNDCPDQVLIQTEGSNIKTGVRFANGKIIAPLAFTGSKNLLGCQRFKGWAQASIDLRFDKEKQTVYGQINVEGVNLDGAPEIVGSVATLLIQRSINQRINPLEILRAPQLALAMPIQSTNGMLNAKVRDVRYEVADGKLILHLTFDFAGVRGSAPPQG
ncbi:MAG: hypothetical protein QOH25_3354 [Acidobacteriota bacterium]|jgi:hypothetical protein|nr:hypothetical protein [Acidobacteriota bacterium]